MFGFWSEKCPNLVRCTCVKVRYGGKIGYFNVAFIDSLLELASSGLEGTAVLGTLTNDCRKQLACMSSAVW